MNKVSILVVLPLALGGCASSGWHKAAIPISKLEQDKYECEYEAKAKTVGGTYSAPVIIALEPTLAGISTAVSAILPIVATELKAQELEAICLKVRGYRNEFLGPEIIGFSPTR
jgi:hypothetical protein